ncbi:unnamed protein product [Phytomonas sp. EM1]|nr:unnamed protein product [Phytomonas sp. EM1]|eukprot:CCW60154.1 unnamed protein product [Phytomonas sp. isolate EM1]
MGKIHSINNAFLFPQKNTFVFQFEAPKVNTVKTFSIIDMTAEKRPLESFHKVECISFINKLWEADTLSMFHHPVSTTEVPNYHDVIKNPMDLSTIKAKIEKGAYKQDSDVETDVALMLTNALQFNEKGTVWYNLAKDLRKKYATFAKECGLAFDADGAFIPTKKARDDETTIRKAERKYKEELNEVINDLEKDKEIPLEELRALYKRDSSHKSPSIESSKNEGSYDSSKNSSSDDFSDEENSDTSSNSDTDEDSASEESEQ